VACFNFGKHKGKPVFQVFDEEISYDGWMMNGDFPLYTKKCLEKLWQAHRQQRIGARANVTRAQEQANKQDRPKPIAKKVEDPEMLKPANMDMLQQLASKFKKL